MSFQPSLCEFSLPGHGCHVATSRFLKAVEVRQQLELLGHCREEMDETPSDLGGKIETPITWEKLEDMCFETWKSPFSDFKCYFAEYKFAGNETNRQHVPPKDHCGSRNMILKFPNPQGLQK